jgi:RNA polymerase-binding protein DksA
MAKRATTAAKATPVKKAAPAKVASATPAKTAKAASATNAAKKAAPAKKTSTPASKSAPSTAAAAAEGATMARTAAAKTSSAKAASAKTAAPVKRGTRTAAESEKIRVALQERCDELRQEYDQTIDEISEAQRDRLTDSAGDDQADTGTKTFEREQEISLANNILERINQVERALERLEEGNYGWCEKCGTAIPVERLAAFPSATLCVSCKQLEERR